MSFKSSDVAKCDACGHVWLPCGDELPRRCAKCKSSKWNASAGLPSPKVDQVDDGKEVVELRISPGDRRMVEHMAKQAGKSETDLIMGRVWGEIDESSHAEVPAVASAHVSVAPAEPFGDKLADLKARFGLKTASQLEHGESAAPPDRAVTSKPKACRAFNGHRPQWYNPLGSGDWWEMSQDVSTGQVWLVANGVAREFDSEQEAKAFVEQRE